MKPTQNAEYRPQLDALRAFAIFAVMIQHWAEPLTQWLPWGELGVRCFFVLSGFLITGILLRSRGAVENGRTTVGWQFRQFYARRSLRIFPIYYLTLAAGCVLGMSVLKETLPWHATYLSNFYFAQRGTWHGNVSHLWSLAVEEQFYLIWPALVLLVPRRWLPGLFAACVVLAPIARAVCATVWGPESITLQVLTPCCLDSLVSGALLAWWVQKRGGLGALPQRAISRIMLVGGAWTAVFIALRFTGTAPTLVNVLGPIAEAALFVGVVASCARGVQGRMARVLDHPFLQYTGRISYGLYLYHMFARYIGGMIGQKFGFQFPAEPGVLQFALLFAMSYAAAALSARLIEAPMNALKRYFPTLPSARPALPSEPLPTAPACGSRAA
jgi:peptidoglycan/LPS O-acetylase OafA/YrhL